MDNAHTPTVDGEDHGEPPDDWPTTIDAITPEVLARQSRSMEAGYRHLFKG